MADLGRTQSWLVSPNLAIEIKWVEVQIQEKKSRLNAAKQTIEDLQKGKIVELEAQIMMLEKEIAFLENKKQNVTVTDVN